MEEGRLMVPKEAEKEILNGNDELKSWFKVHNDCVRPYTEEELVIVRNIVNKYPNVSQYKSVRSVHADPFVVALAKVEDAIVVTWEGPNGSKDTPAIPDLCKEYEIEWCTMVGLFEREGWSFRH